MTTISKRISGRIAVWAAVLVLVLTFFAVSAVVASGHPDVSGGGSTTTSAATSASSSGTNPAAPMGAFARGGRVGVSTSGGSIGTSAWVAVGATLAALAIVLVYLGRSGRREPTCVGDACSGIA